jgi:hypothetical protein
MHASDDTQHLLLTFCSPQKTAYGILPANLLINQMTGRLHFSSAFTMDSSGIYYKAS